MPFPYAYNFTLFLEIVLTNARGGSRLWQIVDAEIKPGAFLRDLLARYGSPKVPGLSPFTGGLVGYFSYGYVKYAEPSLSLDADDTEGFQDMDLMLFDGAIGLTTIVRN